MKKVVGFLLTGAVVLSGCGRAAVNRSSTLDKYAEPTSSSMRAGQTPVVTLLPSPFIVTVRPTTTPRTTTPRTTAPATTAAPTTAAPTTRPKRLAFVVSVPAALARLRVKEPAAATGYKRAQFGRSWFDTDNNGCDTRNDILRRDLRSLKMKNNCSVLAGTLDPDPYTGKTIRFVYGGASEVDIDHLVSLSNAWQTGAAGWPLAKRMALANDPLNLLAVDASTNRSKGDDATWLPGNKGYRCTYVARQVAVKTKYRLWITPPELKAMTQVLRGCPSMPLPEPGPAPTVAVPPSDG